MYEANKMNWLQKHTGQFVVVKGEHALGFFKEFHTAYLAGVEAYGAGADFLVKRLTEKEPVFFVF